MVLMNCDSLPLLNSKHASDPRNLDQMNSDNLHLLYCEHVSDPRNLRVSYEFGQFKFFKTVNMHLIPETFEGQMNCDISKLIVPSKK